ncbi:MAG: hypothetical protein RIQ81_143 [Pseudomonadota bacterium]
MANTTLGDRILVMGAGNFGTCLAQHLAEKGHPVTIWARSPEIATGINQNRKNPKYLTALTLSSRITAINNITDDVLREHRIIVLATAAQALSEVLKILAAHGVTRDHLLVCAAKGIEVSTMRLPGQMISDALGEDTGKKAVFLSGPSFASEVASHQPTAVVAASHDTERAQTVQALFHAPHFRVYTSDDPVGVELAGALKNVIAIAAGASVGLGFEMNSRAALITRGLAEISRIGRAMGANPLTFVGLAGVGDLFLTCTSEKSRNFQVGFRLGRGEKIDRILATLGSVSEGYATTMAAKDLAQKLGVDAPITEATYGVLYEARPIAQAVMGLLTRDAKPEIDKPK